MRPARFFCALSLMLLPALPLWAEAPAPPASPPSAPAGTPLDGAAFEARVTGRTLIWAQGGVVFGTEEYLPGRRVRWAFSGDICQSGRWYEAGEQICFVYDAEPNPQCWTFWADGDSLRARFAGDPPGAELSAVDESPGPLRCAGPDVGV